MVVATWSSLGVDDIDTSVDETDVGVNIAVSMTGSLGAFYMGGSAVGIV